MNFNDDQDIAAVNEAPGTEVAPFDANEKHFRTQRTQSDDGDETEEIEDLRMIRRGQNFPITKKRKKKVKKNSFARVRSFQQLAASAAKEEVKGEKSRNNSNGGSENDTDERVNNEATNTLSKSHGVRSFKKPCSTSSQRKGNVQQDCNDNDSAYTGKSFYDCPNQ